MLGVDLSNNNGSVVWDDLKAAGVKFAICKASEGVNFEDANFSAYRREAARAGIAFGAYHYARPDLNTPEFEARAFAATVGSLHKNELRPVLDLEVMTTTIWPRLFLIELERLLGVRPMLYSYPSFLDALMRKDGAEYLRQWPLWLADYGPDDGEEHPIPPEHTFGFRVVCHQYTQRGAIAGMTGLDLDSALTLNDLREQGDYLVWREWVLAGKPAPKPAGLPNTIPLRWLDAYAVDFDLISGHVAPLTAEIGRLQGKLADSQAALATALGKIDNAKAALG